MMYLYFCVCSKRQSRAYSEESHCVLKRSPCLSHVPSVECCCHAYCRYEKNSPDMVDTHAPPHPHTPSFLFLCFFRAQMKRESKLFFCLLLLMHQWKGMRFRRSGIYMYCAWRFVIVKIWPHDHQVCCSSSLNAYKEREGEALIIVFTCQANL